MRPKPTPWELMCSAPWFEKLGMALFLGLHAWAVLDSIVDFIFR